MIKNVWRENCFSPQTFFDSVVNHCFLHSFVEREGINRLSHERCLRCFMVSLAATPVTIPVIRPAAISTAI